MIFLHKISVNRNIYLILAFSFVLSGCGLWTNFKTYFNTYYNANKIFEESETQVLEARTELFYYEEAPISKTLVSNFDDVIEKTSAILQHNKESDYVDEALLMTGKSFYYQQNYSRALRKFNELGTVEDSEYQLVNKLWIGKTLLQLREFNKALNVLDEVKKEAAAAEEEEVLEEVYKSKIGYLIYEEEFETALIEIDEFLATDIDDELRAEVYYEMGLLYNLTEDYENAEKAFQSVEDYSPTFEVEYSSKFEIAKIKNRLGFQDESLQLLKDLGDEDKYSDNWDEINLEIGKLLYDKNEIDEAFEKFTDVDTTYKDTEAASIARFYRAEILENQYRDYDSALVLYKQSGSAKTPEELRFVAQKKSALLNRYISYHKKLDDFEIQLEYILEPQKFIEDSLEYVEKIRQDSIKQAELAEEQTTNRRGGRNQKKTTLNIKPPVRPKISADSVKALRSKDYFNLANLLFSEFDDPDSAFYYYKLSLEDDPHNPNEAQTYFAMGNYYLIKEEKSKADSMFTIVYDNFEFDPIRNEAAKILGKPLYDFDKDPVEDEYIEAEEIYFDKKYDSAISKLYDIYQNNPKSIYASKSLYTIGYILENDLDLPDSAASIYGILSKKYRTSEYAKAIQTKYTGYMKEMEAQKENDSLKSEETEINDQITAKPDEEIKQQAEDIVEKNVEDKTSPEQEPPIVKTEIEDSISEQPENELVVESETDPETKIVPPEDVNTEDIAVVSKDIYKDKGKYYVQVSSWKTKEIADSELQKLIEKKYNAFIFKIFLEEKNAVYYRVRVGPYDSFQAAKNVRLKLNKY